MDSILIFVSYMKASGVVIKSEKERRKMLFMGLKVNIYPYLISNLI